MIIILNINMKEYVLLSDIVPQKDQRSKFQKKTYEYIGYKPMSKGLPEKCC